MSGLFSVLPVKECHIPKDNRRIVLEFVMRDEGARYKYEYLFREMGLPVTDSVCNGKYHGMRTLTSFWGSDLDSVGDVVPLVYDAIKKEPFDARVCPCTPQQTDVPFRVLKYMGEGSKHHSCEELSIHCAMTLDIHASTQELFELCESLNKAPNSYNVVNKELGCSVITATLGAWKTYLSDQSMITSVRPEPRLLYSAVQMYFYKIYPRPSVGIPIKLRDEDDDDRDDLWRK